MGSESTACFRPLDEEPHLEEDAFGDDLEHGPNKRPLNSP